MTGGVDRAGRALLRLSVRPTDLSSPWTVEAWIDTGFNGDLVLPQRQIDAMSLAQSSTVKAVLADGKEFELDTFACFIDWFGKMKRLEVVANEGIYPLLGIGLLFGHDLHISYRSGDIAID